MKWYDPVRHFFLLPSHDKMLEMPTLLTETWNKEDESYSKNQGARNKPMTSIKLLNALHTWSENSETGRLLPTRSWQGAERKAANSPRQSNSKCPLLQHEQQKWKGRRGKRMNQPWREYFNYHRCRISSIKSHEYSINVSTLPKQKNYPLTTMRLRLTLSFLFAPLELSPGSFASPTAPQSRNRWRKLPLSGNKNPIML